MMVSSTKREGIAALGLERPEKGNALSAAMVGLVWADTVWTLFIFWELTSITSFLLVGFKHTDPVARIAARRALVITAAGGLSLLAGFVLFVDAAGTARLSDIAPITGATANAAAILILVAAATKSALVSRGLLGNGFQAKMKPSPLPARLRGMKQQLDRGEDTAEHKLRYLLWLN